jgi:hypothetical protein
MQCLKTSIIGSLIKEKHVDRDSFTGSCNNLLYWIGNMNTVRRRERKLVESYKEWAYRKAAWSLDELEEIVKNILEKKGSRA